MITTKELIDLIMEEYGASEEEALESIDMCIMDAVVYLDIQKKKREGEEDFYEKERDKFIFEC